MKIIFFPTDRNNTTDKKITSMVDSGFTTSGQRNNHFNQLKK
jgi:hypothetical protein